MTHAIDAPRLEAFKELLTRPDPLDLPRRAYIVRWEGEPDRRSTRLPPLMAAWLQRHFLEIDGEGALPPGVRVRTRPVPVKTPRIRVVVAAVNGLCLPQP